MALMVFVLSKVRVGQKTELVVAARHSEKA